MSRFITELETTSRANALAVRSCIYPRNEASHYVKRLNKQSKIPYLGRANSILFIDGLYDKGALSVEISATSRTFCEFITEIIVKPSGISTARDIIAAIIDANPTYIEETRVRVYRVGWKLNH